MAGKWSSPNFSGISTAILRFAIGLPLRVYSKRNVERNMELRAYRVALIEFLSAAAEAKKKYKKWSDDAAQQYINQEVYRGADMGWPLHAST